MNKEQDGNPIRRRVVGALALGAVVSFVSPRLSEAKGLPIKVYKNSRCDCCDDWITHLEANGFSAMALDEGNSDAQKRLGMPARFSACHTGEINGYAIEGHVPAKEIHRLLQERPDAVGLSVPDMPRGSPGMDGSIYGGIVDPYDVLLIGTDGEATVFQSYR